MSNAYQDYGEIRITLTTEYNWVYDDSGTGANSDVTFWHPKTQGGLRPLGSVGIGNHGDSANGQRATVLIGASAASNPSKPAVAQPTAWEKVWDDGGSGGKHDGAVWRAVAPAGYRALGDVAWGGYGWPPMDAIWCVRSDLCSSMAQLSDGAIWTDAGSGARMDLSCWPVIPVSAGVNGNESIPLLTGNFLAYGHHHRPDAAPFTVALKVPNAFKDFSTPPPKITPTTIPTKGKVYNDMTQCAVTLPFTAYFPPTDARCVKNIKNPFCTLSRSISWIVEAVWWNEGREAFERAAEIKYGVSKTKSQEMEHTVGVTVSAGYGIGLQEYSISLNYQFTTRESSSHTEYTEETVKETKRVAPGEAVVLFCQRISLRGERADGSVISDNAVLATNTLYFTACDLPKNFSAASLTQ
ncbi:hypothetical protein PT974_04436 [Cladobotryum mycophilum]|uniref:Insecticidal crystal toxin domain-containing protein n=1 Tax=Cladobotryum mycophilum TaxID=491253 RepID=A0ABR0SV37_9HYPO